MPACSLSAGFSRTKFRFVFHATGATTGRPPDGAGSRAGRLSAGAPCTAGGCAAKLFARAAGRDRVAVGNAAVRVDGGFSAFMMPLLRNLGTQVTSRRSSVSDAGLLQGLGMRVLEGRALADTYNANAPPALVVNRSFARTYLPEAGGHRTPQPSRGSPACGSVRRTLTGKWSASSNTFRQDSVEAPREPELFATFQQDAPEQLEVRSSDPHRQDGRRSARLWCRSSGRRSSRTSAVGLHSVMTMEDRIEQPGAAAGYALLRGVFAISAMLISGVGLSVCCPTWWLSEPERSACARLSARRGAIS